MSSIFRKIKWDWSDMFPILEAAVIINRFLPDALEEFKLVLQSDPTLMPVVSMLEQVYEQVTEDGEITFRDVMPVMMAFLPLIGMYTMVRDQLEEIAKENQKIAPIYRALDGVYVALTT